MAHEYVSLLSSIHSQSSSRSGEVLTLSTVLQIPGLRAEPGMRVAQHCYLVSMSSLPGTAQVFAGLEMSFLEGRVGRKKLQLPGAFAEPIGSSAEEGSTLAAVVLALNDERIDVPQAQQLIDEVRAENPSGSAVVVAVTRWPAEWEALREIDGLVHAQGPSTVRVAAQVFAGFATTCASTLWSGLDGEDLREAAGNLEAPARALEALWLEEPKQLLLARDEDELALQQAGHVYMFAFPLGGSIRLAAHLREALQELSPRAEVQTQVAPRFLAAPPLGAAGVPVLLLTR